LVQPSVTDTATPNWRELPLHWTEPSPFPARLCTMDWQMSAWRARTSSNLCFDDTTETYAEQPSGGGDWRRWLVGPSVCARHRCQPWHSCDPDVHADKGQAVCASISQELNTDKVSFVQVDITSKDSLQSAIHSLQNQYGRIDAVVNNAYPRNAQYGRRFEDVEYSDFCDNLGLNLGGMFLTSQQFANQFQKQGTAISSTSHRCMASSRLSLRYTPTPP
jgi:hypothetical protein